LTDDVVVPDFRGQQALNAWLAGHDAGVLLQGPDPDAAQPVMNGIVVAQEPAPGTLVERWGTVTVWVRLDPGDGSDVREPRHPTPPLGVLRIGLPEPEVDR
jgi:beta-lactam-binding protein with PASTA domain